MHPDLIKQALDAIEAGDPKKAMELLKGMIADAAGAGPDADGDEDGTEGDGAEGVAPPAEAAVEDPKVVPASEEPDDDGDDEDKPAKKVERKAMRAMLNRLTDSQTFAEALVKVGEYRASHLTMETERQKLAADRATLESAERRSLVVELVKLGAEFPATVWADDKAATIKPRWAKMPLVELKAHVAEQRAARNPKKKPNGVNPPAGSDTSVELSAAELQICADLKCDPKDFAALKAVRDSGETHLLQMRQRTENAHAQIAAATKKGV